MSNACKLVVLHNQHHPARQVKFLQLTLCTSDDEPDAILEHLGTGSGVQRVTFRWHDHWKLRRWGNQKQNDEAWESTYRDRGIMDFVQEVVESDDYDYDFEIEFDESGLP